MPHDSKPLRLQLTLDRAIGVEHELIETIEAASRLPERLRHLLALGLANPNRLPTALERHAPVPAPFPTMSARRVELRLHPEKDRELYFALASIGARRNLAALDLLLCGLRAERSLAVAFSDAPRGFVDEQDEVQQRSNGTPRNEGGSAKRAPSIFLDPPNADAKGAFDEPDVIPETFHAESPP